MLNIVIPMAGRGSRFAKAGYVMPKPLIPIHDHPMIEYVIRSVTPDCPHRFIFLCLKEHMERYDLERRLQSFAPGCIVVPIDQVTEGAACTVLLAERWIDSDDPMMIANSDQYVDIDINAYLAAMGEADGLIMTLFANDTKWSFIRGNVTHGDVKTTVVPGSDPEETVSTWEVSLGSIAVSFDRRLYVNEKDKNDTRTYSTKYISSFVWEGNSKADSIVIFEPHRDSAYVKFLPDTSKPEWQALMDTTKFNTLTVKGKVHAFDRYGGRSVFPVEMVWYSRYQDTVTLNLKVSDFIQENPDGSTTRKTYEYDLTSALEKLGYKESEVESTPRKKVVHGIITGPGSKVLMTYSNENSRVVILRTYVPKAALVGTHYNLATREVKTFPSEKDPVLEMSAIECPLVIKIVITE